MTDQERNDRFDVRWNGRGYLCVFPPALPKIYPERQLSAFDADQPYVKTRRVKVLQSMPGTIHELAARSGCNPNTVNSVLGVFRRAGQLRAERPGGRGLQVYRVVPEGRP